jgi:adenosine kinase
MNETGACAVVVHGKERALCAYLGASCKYSTEHLNTHMDILRQTKIIYASGFFITSNPIALRQIAAFCTEHDKTFAFNLSALFIIQFTFDEVKNAIEHADFVFCNEDECDAYGKMVGIMESDRDETAKKLALQPKTNTKRPRTVIIT